MSSVAVNARPESLLNLGSKQRLPVIQQTEAAECGLTCLAMIAGFYGYETDMLTLRSRFSISSRGINAEQLMNIAAKMHLAGRALKIDLPYLNHVQLPCILHWDMNHFVVLKSVKRNNMTIHDPSSGERKMGVEEFTKHFTGIAIEFIPTDNFEMGDDKKKLRMRHFWTRIIGLKRSLFKILLISLLLQLFSIITPFYMQTVIDDVILRNDSGLLLALAIGFGLLLLVEIGASTLREVVVLNLSCRLNIQVTANLFRHLIRLPMDYFIKRHMGDIVSRFGSLDKVQEMLTTGIISALVDGVMAIITLVAMFIYDIQLALIVVAIVVLYAMLRILLYRPLRLLTEESIIAGAHEDSHFMESMRAIQTIKLFQRENDRQNQWQNLLVNKINKDIKIAQWNIQYNVIERMLFGIENIVVIYCAATAVMDNQMTVGMLYAFIAYKTRFVASMDKLITSAIEIKMLGLHLNRLADITFTPAEAIDEQSTSEYEHELTNSDSLDRVNGSIRVNNLSYSYSKDEAPIFSKLYFDINAGETIAITGPSGCGKTTLLKCLMGLLSPTHGEIYIDDRPLTHIKHYRSRIAAVMQNDELMSGTIADNIACFEPQLDQSRIITYAQMACIHDEIMQMPMAYNTLVGDFGSSLSGGQQQRIILARALYHNPAILFLDEATSHLDVKNETEVNKQIKKLNITRIIIAHRPETIASADRCIELTVGNHPSENTPQF